MKSLLLGLGLIFSFTTAQAESPQSLGGGQAALRVSEVQVEDLDQDMSQCVFRVNIVDFVNDVACTNRASDLASCESVVEMATYIDEACTLKVGDVIQTTTDQYSSGDLRSAGVFTWVILNAGYQSHIMFPNYGK